MLGKFKNIFTWLPCWSSFGARGRVWGSRASGPGDHLRVGSGGHEGAAPSRPGCPVAQCPSPPAALCPFLPGDRGSSHFAPWGGGEGFCAHYPDAHLDRSAWQSLQAPGCINSGTVVIQFWSPQEITPGWMLRKVSHCGNQPGGRVGTLGAPGGSRRHAVTLVLSSLGSPSD